MERVKDLLLNGGRAFGLELSSVEIDAFQSYLAELKKWGAKINLTALLDDEKKIVEELFLDSLSPLIFLRSQTKKEGRLLDIGSGGGFPGIPIKIVSPRLMVTLCDSIEKKVFFIRHVIRTLSLSGAEAMATRFDDSGSPALERASFDWAASKAVTDIERMGRWAGPHLRKGGVLICMKGPKEAPPSMAGYSAPAETPYTLPLTGRKRRLYLYEKI